MRRARRRAAHRRRFVIPDKDRTLRKGAIAPWAKSSSPYYVQTLNALGKHYKFTLDTKWKDLGQEDAGSDPLRLRRRRDPLFYDDGMRAYETKRVFEGVVHQLERRFKETESDWARDRGSPAISPTVPCAACNGLPAPTRSAVRQASAGKHIGEVSDHIGQRRSRLVHRATPAADPEAERNRRGGCSRKSATG